MKNDNKYSFEIIKEIAVIGTRENMNKEANIVSWNRQPPVIDIRYWNADHTEMSSGITLTQSELTAFMRGVKAWTEENRK